MLDQKKKVPTFLTDLMKIKSCNDKMLVAILAQDAIFYSFEFYGVFLKTECMTLGILKVLQNNKNVLFSCFRSRLAMSNGYDRMFVSILATSTIFQQNYS